MSSKKGSYKRKAEKDYTDNPWKQRMLGKYNKNKKNKLPTMLICKSPSFLPDIYVCKLKMAVAATPVSTSGAPSSIIVRGNDLWDPLGGSGTLQPNGFDALKNLYGYWVVTGSSCTVKACPRAVVGCDIVLAPIAVSSSSPATWTTDELYASTSRARRQYGFLYEKLEMSQYCSTATVFGENPTAVLTEDSYTGTATSSPTSTSIWSWVLNYQPTDKSTTSTLDVVLEIVYYVRFISSITTFDT